MIRSTGRACAAALVIVSSMGIGATADPSIAAVGTTAAAEPDEGVQAAVRYGWGRPRGGDEFNGTALDTSTWYPYYSIGHAGNGLRRPAKITQGGGVLTISGDSVGTTGGMAARQGHKYGRWETRMRVPSGDVRYHPVLLLWPDAEDFPVGGEVDYAETTAASDGVAFFLHYSRFNLFSSRAQEVDIRQWHNYAVEWTPRWVRGYVDGVLFFSDTTPERQPPRSMHQSIQLDWFPSGRTATTPSSMQVAWNRYYPV